MKIFFRSYMTFLLITSFISLSNAELIMVADGGSLIDEPFIPNIRYDYLSMTLCIDNASGGETVSGSISHPYGEGPFEVEVSSRRIPDVSVSTFDTHINFVINIPDEISNSPIDVFTAKPIPGPGVQQNSYDIDRDGSFQNGYPYALQWLEFNAVDRSGNSISTDLHTDPVFESTDFGSPVFVTTSGFQSRVQNIFITAVNDVAVYPFRKFRRLADNSFELPGFTVGINSGSHHFSILVELEDGTEHRYSDSYPNTFITLTPQSTVSNFSLYQ